MPSNFAQAIFVSKARVNSLNSAETLASAALRPGPAKVAIEFLVTVLSAATIRPVCGW
jgi:hypothetical protein